MAREADFQSKVLKWLRSKGCIAYKMQQNATTRIATPDIVWFYKSRYGFLEVKRAQNASFRPGQKEMVAKLNKWSYARVVFPENFNIIKIEIDRIISNEDMQDSGM